MLGIVGEGVVASTIRKRIVLNLLPYKRISKKLFEDEHPSNRTNATYS